MEIFYGVPSTVKLNIGSDADQVLGVYQVFVTVTRARGALPLLTDSPATRESVGLYSKSFNSSFFEYPETHKIEWEYTISGSTFNKTTIAEVVVRYTSPSEFKDAFPLHASKSDAEIYRKEKLARRIVDAYCGQSFGFEKGVTKSVRGNNASRLHLPARLWSLSGTEDDDENLTSSTYIVDDYWVEGPGFGEVDIKSGITEPGNFFKGTEYYEITGNWGWEYVPEDIKFATQILMNDYFTDDSLLHQHGVISAQLGDRMLNFRNDVWNTTGNYEADMLLNQYIVPGIAWI